MRRILSVRNDKELRMLRQYGLATALNTTLWSGIPLLVAFSSFMVAALTSSEPLTSDVIFPAISLFNLLSFPLAMLATVIGNLVESIVSISRISEMLNAEELQTDARTVEEKALNLGDEVTKLGLIFGHYLTCAIGTYYSRWRIRVVKGCPATDT
jgi:ATP-binding cassette, subfamily C (CFTR/MRP), member 1